MKLADKKQKLFANVGIITLAIYAVIRIGFFWVNKFSLPELVYAVIFFCCEFFILLHTLGFFVTTARVAAFRIKEQNEQKAQEPLSDMNFPSVAVLVAARHEPYHILEKTFTTLKNLDYPHKQLYFLDDSSEENYNKEAEKIAEKFGARIFRRMERHGAKAGIINDFLKYAEEKYLAVFDADQNPMPDFLIELIALLEKNDKVAFIQTPQFYTNLDIGPVAKASGMQQAVFYESICEAKGIKNAMFCCGTNVVFRTDSLRNIGGFDENSITEDFATSIDFHHYGYESLYYNRVGAFGMAPETLSAYFKQQIRWATGTISTLKKLVRNFFKDPKRLTVFQWWEYFLSGSYYFIGWAIFFLMLSPIINILFDISPFQGNTLICSGAFIAYFSISLTLFYLSMRSRNYSASQIYQGVVLAYISFPILMIASLYGIFAKKVKFVITAKGKYDKLPFVMYLPYLVMICLSIITVTKVITRLTPLHYPELINLFWIVFHLALLMNFFYFNKTIKEK